MSSKTTMVMQIGELKAENKDLRLLANKYKKIKEDHERVLREELDWLKEFESQLFKRLKKPDFQLYGMLKSKIKQVEADDEMR